jgi:predicted regulator of Ras-like GTPase activity (Roadblock/LC7/MglB family)
MTTRQSALLRVLYKLARELPDPLWIALTDSDGLVVACVPENPPVNPEGITAMTAAFVLTGERVLEEIEGGGFRYANISGSSRQLLIVILGEGRFLSIGLGPAVPPRSTFNILSQYIPELLRTLKRRFTTSELNGDILNEQDREN